MNRNTPYNGSILLQGRFILPTLVLLLLQGRCILPTAVLLLFYGRWIEILPTTVLYFSRVGVYSLQQLYYFSRVGEYSLLTVLVLLQGRFILPTTVLLHISVNFIRSKSFQNNTFNMHIINLDNGTSILSFCTSPILFGSKVRFFLLSSKPFPQNLFFGFSFFPLFFTSFSYFTFCLLPQSSDIIFNRCVFVVYFQNSFIFRSSISSRRMIMNHSRILPRGSVQNKTIIIEK